jgi:glycosyltransferase involved in cell wall biosynthesis
MKKKKVLVVTRIYGTFVRRDLSILAKKYTPVCHTYSGHKNMLSQVFGQLRLLFWLIWHIPNSYAVYVWFADYHSFLPVFFARLWKKRSFVVEGGYDTVAMPEINYGSHINPLRSKMSTYAMKHASLNLPVSEALADEIRDMIPEAKVEHVYTGYDTGVFKADGEKETMVLTVANGDSEQRIRLKGIDIFVETARRLPQYRFVIIGLLEKARDNLGDLPANVDLYPPMPQNVLITYYHKAKVYAQFSMREGLPNVVCEAMACECVPVGFSNGGIPIAIGDAGFVTRTNTVEAAVEAVKKAMAASPELGKAARQRIIDTFPHELREEKLLDYFEGATP